MKRTIIAFLLSFLFTISFSQKWKPSFGFEGGMGIGGMNNLLKSTNPLIVDNAELKKSWAYTYGPFIQIMKPAFGLEMKLNWNSFESEAESMTNPESFKLKYMSIPVLLKFRLSSRQGITASSWSDESYTLIGNTLYHTPGQYSSGGSPFTTNIFIYGGMQYDHIRSAIHSFGTTTAVTDNIAGKLVENGYSYVIGLEMSVNLCSFDFSYMKSMKSIDPVTENKVSGFFVKLKLRII